MTDSNVALFENAALNEYLSILTPFFEEKGVTEICINRPQEVWTEGADGWVRHELPKLTHNYCMQLAKLIANYDQQAINEQQPMLSSMLPGNMRVEVLIPPVVESGTVSMTIRRQMSATRPLSAYTDDGAFSRYKWEHPADNQLFEELSQSDRTLCRDLGNGGLEAFLRGAITAKKNIAVVGGTGSGKTTLMKSMCEVIPRTERLTTIEDVRELFLPHGNRVHLTYSSTGKGLAKITPADLIKRSMRMKPDRVLLAELRGAEAFDFLDLLTTGHDGSITSFHAGDCHKAWERYVQMCKRHEKAAKADSQELKHLIRMTIDVLLHVAVEVIHDVEGNFVGKNRYVSEVYFNPFEELSSFTGDTVIFRADDQGKKFSR